MSHTDVEVVRRVYDAVPEVRALLRSGGDLRQHPSLSLWHPECVLEELAEVPDARTYRGREALATFLQRAYDEVWDEWGFVPQEMIAGPEGIFVAVANHGRSRSGVEVDMQIFQTFRLRDGMIVHAAVYLNRGTALKAVGLEE